MASASDRAGEPPIVIGVLAAGQPGGHLVLGSGHNHAPAAGSVVIPAHLMLLAHLGAVILGAALVVAAERLFTSLCSATRSRSQPPRADLPGHPVHVLPVGDHPLRRDLLIAASISHRGPPVGNTR